MAQQNMMWWQAAVVRAGRRFSTNVTKRRNRPKGLGAVGVGAVVHSAWVLRMHAMHAMREARRAGMLDEG